MGVEDYMDLEEQIDEERERVGKTGILINDDTFKLWSEKREKICNSQKTEEAGEEVIRVDENNQLEEKEKPSKTQSNVMYNLFLCVHNIYFIENLLKNF